MTRVDGAHPDVSGVGPRTPRSAFPDSAPARSDGGSHLRAAQGARREPGSAGRSVTDPPPALMPLATFSDRELEILSMVADGLGNKEIARKLGLSPLTVKSHMARMFLKMPEGIPRNRAGMVGWAMRNRLIP